MRVVGEGEGRRATAAMEESEVPIISLLSAVKDKSGKSYTDIGNETGLTNVYVAQLLRRQAQLKPATVPLLRSSLPHLTDDLVLAMMKIPVRSYNPTSIREPSIARLNEAIMHNAESIKAIINEDFGDGIMSAVDFYCSVDKVNGADGNDRVVITFDGKYLPYTEQRLEKMVPKMKSI